MKNKNTHSVSEGQLADLQGKRIFFIGIGGISQSKLALMLASFGALVSGSDREEGEELAMLRAAGIKVFVGHRAGNVESADIVVYNGAIGEDNAELKRARERGCQVVKRSEMLARVAALHKQTVAVCGSHGKTTVTALLGFALKSLQPQMHIGGNLQEHKFTVSENKNLFVTEACEFQKSFLRLAPDVTIMLNIDADHMDCYKDIDEIEATFEQFAKQTKRVIIYNNEDARAKRVAAKAACKRISFGRGGNVWARNVRFDASGIRFDLIHDGKNIAQIEACLFGKHNVGNLLAACAAALVLGAKSFENELKNFAGVERRMQFLGDAGSKKIIHDYAHHPAEVAATIGAVRTHFQKPIVAVFEPHTYTRTKALWDDFTNCFGGAAHTYILPIYSAREKPILGITSEALAAVTKNCTFVAGREQLEEHLKQHENHIILVMGAGSIYKLADQLVDGAV